MSTSGEYCEYVPVFAAVLVGRDLAVDSEQDVVPAHFCEQPPAAALQAHGYFRSVLPVGICTYFRSVVPVSAS